MQVVVRLVRAWIVTLFAERPVETVIDCEEEKSDFEG